MIVTSPVRNVSLPRLRAVLAFLAAPQLTVTGFLLVAAAAVWVSQGGDPTRALLLPLSVMALNLFAALVVSARLRADFPLLVFHLALLSLLIIAALARLIHMEGQVNLTRGVSFDGRVDELTQGPWHRDRWSSIRFVNDTIVDEHPANGNQSRIFNRVRWWGEDGRMHVAEIGNDRPLLLNGYRIYTGPRGPAPLLLWEQSGGAVEYASHQLGIIQADGWQQGEPWLMPGGPEVWLSLNHEFKRPKPGTFEVDLGINDIRSPLIIRSGESRHALTPGESVDLPGGRLTYVRLDVWMGYRISYDVLTPWMAASILLAVASLVAYYLRRVFLRQDGKRRIP